MHPLIHRPEIPPIRSWSGSCWSVWQSRTGVCETRHNLGFSSSTPGQEHRINHVPAQFHGNTATYLVQQAHLPSEPQTYIT